MRGWHKTLGFLTLVTALLPFVLHHRLTQLGRTTTPDDIWRRSVAEVTAPWTLFYHVYFPPNNREGYAHTAAIVAEQLDMLGRSYATQNFSPVLYYTTVGERLRNQTWMTELCRNNRLQCIALPHAQEGQEDLTLQSLYNFCKAMPSQTVLYLHSKGSFHAAGAKFATQDIWRQRLTEAASHQLCLENTVKGTCETCSLLLQPLPGIHYPGNMWAARCAHVRRLWPPNSFAKRMDKVVQKFTILRDTRRRLNTTFFAQMPHMMGRKRFAAEHWVGSHPDLQYPCDLSAQVTANMSEWLHPDGTQRLSSDNFRWGQTPSFPIDFEHWDYFRYGKRGHMVLENPALRLRDYFLLPGQLLKWYQLYQKAPPPDSWVWKWFPDSQVWRAKIQELGLIFWEDDTDDWLPPPVELVV